MQISSASNQINQQIHSPKSDTTINSLNSAKQRLSNQIQKINQDKSIDENSKQEKVKQLQEQIAEIEQLIIKRQMEKLTENSKIDNTKASKVSKPQTAEERKKEANVAMDRSFISVAVNRDHLSSLNGIRNRLINQDGGISESVKRTERMMGKRTQEINKAIAEGQKAAMELAQSDRSINEKERNEKSNVVQGETEKIESVEQTNETAVEDVSNHTQNQNSIDVITTIPRNPSKQAKVFVNQHYTVKHSSEISHNSKNELHVNISL